MYAITFTSLKNTERYKRKIKKKKNKEKEVDSFGKN